MFAGIHDTIGLLKAFARPRRLGNAIKLYFSYGLGKVLGKPIRWGMPMAMSIEPTTACNLGCPQCPSGLKQFTRPTGKMDLANFEKVIQDNADNAGYITLYFQGEPYINKDFTDMIALASQNGMYTATSSNAHFLTPETCEKTVKAGLNRMIISIDGASQETYAKYRIHGDFQQVVDGTRNMLKAKQKLGAKKPVIIWQFIVFAHNEHEVTAIRRLAKEIGVDKLVLKTAQIYDYQHAEDWIPVQNQYSRYDKKADKVTIKAKHQNHCWRMHSNPVVTWDGNMVPCCFDKDASHNMGNVLSLGTQAAWEGEAFDGFRKNLNAGRGEIDICSNCTEGVKVWI
jgi:MoaA/NifB/PqqE/SkfB family radical SAM enzyme